MSFRRRHRWLRRLVLGLAVAATVAAGNASYAFAKIDLGGSEDSRYVTTPGWSGLVDNESGIPLSAGIPEGDEPFVAGEMQVIPYLSHGILTEADRQAALPQPALDGGQGLAAKDAIESRAGDVTSAVRPDDLANRFAHSDVPAPPQVENSSSWTFERGDVVILGIVAVVLALGLGLALGYLSRPRLAGV